MTAAKTPQPWPAPERIASLVKAMREKASGTRNECGDVWGDWICLEAALLVEQHAAAQAAAEMRGREEAANATLERGNFAGYRREELTADYGQPRYDMMMDAVAAIRALPAPDGADALAEMLAAARAEVWRKAAEIARNACLVPPDGGSPTEAEVAMCDEAARQIMAAAREAGR